MDCFEFEGKKVFQSYGIPVPRGSVVGSVEEAGCVFQEIAGPSVLKAQVLSGKRGKAGGIKFIEELTGLAEGYRELSEMEIYNQKVAAVLLEEKLDIEREFYLGITIDPLLMDTVLIFSPEGGMDIEEIAREYPDRLVRERVNGDLMPFQYYELLTGLGLDNRLTAKLVGVISKLVRLFIEVDATTVEINPLVVTREGELIAADSKLVIDDSALFRQNLEVSTLKVEGNELISRADNAGLAYVPLNKSGKIGSVAGGAGLAMATMDTIRHLGAKPANFLDIGGGVSADKMTEAVKIAAARSNVEGLIINVFGGINNCEIMARGIVRAIREEDIKAKIVVKMRGHSQEEGWQLLEEEGIPIIKYGTTEEAVKKLLGLFTGGVQNGSAG